MNPVTNGAGLRSFKQTAAGFGAFSGNIRVPKRLLLILQS
jgi:hypothetical protein